MKPYESPDLYIELEDKIIGIEQFEFSSYLSNKKGNSIKRKLDEVDLNNHKNFLENKSNNYFITEIVTNICKENYEKNFITTFDKHYKRIEQYEKNLSQFKKDIDIYFLICDETIEGTEIIIDGNYEFYVPTMNETILKHIKKCTKVKGLIFQCSCVYNKKLFYYLKNTQENIEKLLEDNTKYFEKELAKENFKRINSFWRFDVND